MTMSIPRRVMIVEDSAVVRTLLSHIISADSRLTVAASVESGEAALAALDRVRPDVISMDIRLPGIDGLETTRRIMAEHPTPIVVISASIEKASLGPSMEALSAGALSVVEKPVGVTHLDYAPVAREICTQLAIMSDVAVVRRRMRAEPPPAGSPDHAPDPRTRLRLMVVAASTGGPQALARLFGMLPADWPLPVLLVQHMGAAFMAGFADWLDGVVPQRVVIAIEGAEPEPGTIHVAPGNRHLRIDGAGRMRLGNDPAIAGQRPSATALFGSAGDAFGAAAVGVVLTGMGEDGAAGVLRMVQAGAPVLAEHAGTAVVYGMPAAAARAGAVPVPIELVAPELARILARSRRPRP